MMAVVLRDRSDSRCLLIIATVLCLLMFGANCGPRPTGDGPPFLAMHKGHIFGSIKLATVFFAHTYSVRFLGHDILCYINIAPAVMFCHSPLFIY